MSHSPLWDTDLTYFQRIKFEKGKKMMTGKSGTPLHQPNDEGSHHQ